MMIVLLLLAAAAIAILLSGNLSSDTKEGYPDFYKPGFEEQGPCSDWDKLLKMYGAEKNVVKLSQTRGGAMKVSPEDRLKLVDFLKKNGVPHEVKTYQGKVEDIWVRRNAGQKVWKYLTSTKYFLEVLFVDKGIQTSLWIIPAPYTGPESRPWDPNASYTHNASIAAQDRDIRSRNYFSFVRKPVQCPATF